MVEGPEERCLAFREYCNEMVTARGIVSPRNTTSIGVISDIVIVTLVSNISRVTHDEEEFRCTYDIIGRVYIYLLACGALRGAQRHTLRRVARSKVPQSIAKGI